MRYPQSSGPFVLQRDHLFCNTVIFFLKIEQKYPITLDIELILIDLCESQNPCITKGFDFRNCINWEDDRESGRGTVRLPAFLIISAEKMSEASLCNANYRFTYCMGGRYA